MLASRLAYLFSGRVHYAWVVLAVVFTATLAGVGVRAAPGVMIVPLQHAFGWDISTISGAISLNIILLGATGPFHDRADAGHRPEAHDPVMPGVADGRHRAVHLHDRVLAVVPHLGPDGRHRLRRRRGRHGGGGGEPLVRAAHRLCHGPAHRGQCRRPIDLPAAARLAGRALRLARRRHLRHARGCRGVSDRRDHAAGVTRPDRPHSLRQHGNAAARLRPRRRRQSVHGGDPGADPRFAIDGFLAAVPDLRRVRVLHQRADQHPPHRLLRRPWHRRGQRRVDPGGDRGVQPDRLDRFGLDVRPVQSPRAAVLVLWAARAFAGAVPFTSFDPISLSVFAVFYGWTGWRLGRQPSH